MAAAFLSTGKTPGGAFPSKSQDPPQGGSGPEAGVWVSARSAESTSSGEMPSDEPILGGGCGGGGTPGVPPGLGGWAQPFPRGRRKKPAGHTRTCSQELDAALCKPSANLFNLVVPEYYFGIYSALLRNLHHGAFLYRYLIFMIANCGRICKPAKMKTGSGRPAPPPRCVTGSRRRCRRACRCWRWRSSPSTTRRACCGSPSAASWRPRRCWSRCGPGEAGVEAGGC